MKKLKLTLCLMACSLMASAQQTHYYKGIPQPLYEYEELADPKPHDPDSKWAQMKRPVELSWASTDVRYAKHNVPTVKTSTAIQMKAWRGERVNAQALLWTRGDLSSLTLAMSDLKSAKGSVIPSTKVRTEFVRYVMTDELNKDGKGGCGCRDNREEWDSSLVADVLDNAKSLPVKRNSTQPLWVNVWVPSDAKPGIYNGVLTVSADGMETQQLQLSVEVLNRTLPSPRKWRMNLDLWQNPYAVARYYGVPLWSREHFDAMLPIMKMLADAGQQSITASIMHKPWNGQTEDHFDSMVSRIHHLDGSWSYDYAVFDRWVEFMTNEVGIDGLISCYTMIPWNLHFDYYDEATNRIQFVDAKPGDSAYTEYWGGFLRDFAKHLRQKGWFERTAISMDERPMEAMQAAIKVIRDADKDFKITLAGNYHDEIQQDLYYLSIPYGQHFPDSVLAERRRRHQISTYYTCCTEPFPGTFSFSNPADATWIGIHAVAGDYDGYLRWAVNSWTADPLRDTRFHTWAAGDTYSLYPGARSSIRFERLVEGMQDAEKILLLRETYGKTGQKQRLKKLNRLVATFTPGNMTAEKEANAASMVKALEKMLNE